ncbi:MAG TPA: hypothetical protein VMA36_16095 [Candidatus Limnocylindria bacterium]|jgi:hypothetical protein|nr:hypothetical protein [Candidatus Limnocylindria bacterium]
MEKTAPTLALALAITASSRLRLEEREPAFRAAFVAAVAALDDADVMYRRAIETAVPSEAAAIVAAMRSFREQVAGVRERAREAIGEAYRRHGRVYGAFDPLDAYLPPTDGLSHADATRVATMADTARGQVDTLRAQVNQGVVARLAPPQIEMLIAAKRRRREAFEAALRGAVESVVGGDVTRDEREKTVYGLVALADGWY